MNRFFTVIFFYLIFISSLIANPNLNIRTGILVDYHSDEILYEFEVNDKKAYRDIWKGEMPLRATDAKIYEYACHEGNYAMANILAGARAEESQ